MKLFDQLKIGSLYKGSALRKIFPGINSTFLVNFKIKNLKSIVEFLEQHSFYNYAFVFTVTDKFLKGKDRNYSRMTDLATSSKIIVAFKTVQKKSSSLQNKKLDEANFEKMNVEVPGFYRQGSYMSIEEEKRDWILVHKKPGFRLKPETEKHFGDILTSLNFNESCRSILKENMDYLDIGAITQGEQDFVKMAADYLLNAAYNNTMMMISREGHVGSLLKMGNLFEKATGFALPDAFMRKFFYVYPTSSYYGDGNQRQYIIKNYIDKYKLNLMLPQTGGFWLFSVVNSLIFKLIDHHKRKEIYDVILPLLSRYFISGLHELAETVATDALFSKNEIEKLKNYFVRRKLKPETDKHFGNILTSL